jgi:hypothetical protein
VRILVVSALLLATASCATPPQQQGANCPEARQELAAAAAVAKPPPAAVPAPATAAPPTAAAAYGPWPFPAFPLFQAPVRAGRLTLSNVTFGSADVEAFVTPYPDCALHPGLTPRNIQLPLNGTWIIPSPPGSDVCWQQLAPGAPQAAASAQAEWNRAFTAAGRYVDARL